MNRMKDRNIIVGNLDNKEILDQATTYYDNRIAVIEEVHNIDMKQTIWIEAVCAILCKKGKASVYINGQLYDIHENDLLLCRPNIILEHGMISVDFDCYGFLLSPEYIERMAVSTCWNAQLFIQKHPVISLEYEEVQVFHQYFELLRNKLTKPSGKHQKELIDSLLQAFLYEFHDSMKHFEESQMSFSSAETLFKSFISLLNKSYPKERSVSSYADKLCVSPKYLSSICKGISQHTASELINQYVIKDIEYLLKRTNKSVKEIANELNFPNLSFFGKYTKRYLGMSPKQYRNQMLSSDNQP